MNIKQCWIWCVVTALALAGCTESFKPDVSTETGNPPVIDGELVALVVTSDEVHVRGEAGAVTPPKGDVEITVVRNQAVTTGPVAADGSFDVLVEATLDDVFEVRAVQGGERSTAVIVVRGGAMVGDGDGGTLTCEQTTTLARDAVDQAIAVADRRCASDDDCMLAPKDTDCYATCSYEYVSAEGSASVLATIDGLNDDLCASFADECGAPVIPPCVPPEPAKCDDDGLCTSDSGGQGICDTCIADGTTADDSFQLGWRITSAGTLPALPSQESLAVGGCNQLTRSAENELLCTLSVNRCDEAASIEALVAALQDPDVTEAILAGGEHGAPVDEAGYYYQITTSVTVVAGFGMSSFTYRSCATSGCDVPPGLERLRVVLDAIEAKYTCDSVLTTDACSAPFEVGECDAAIPVWWHNPDTGACTPQTYGGCSGNDNRYESLEACQAACPPPVEQSDCAADRKLTSMCIECGAVGGCSQEVPGCLKPCDSLDDCADELGPFGDRAVCDGDGVCSTPLFCL